MRLKYVRIPGTFNINLNLQDIWTRQVYHAMPLWRAECWDSTTYFSKVSPTSNCFSRNNLQMLTWARRLETGVVQSLHDCQFLEEASIVLSRGVVLKITLATWHVTRDCGRVQLNIPERQRVSRKSLDPADCLYRDGLVASLVMQTINSNNDHTMTCSLHWQWQWHIAGSN